MKVTEHIEGIHPAQYVSVARSSGPYGDSSVQSQHLTLDSIWMLVNKYVEIHKPVLKRGESVFQSIQVMDMPFSWFDDDGTVVFDSDWGRFEYTTGKSSFVVVVRGVDGAPIGVVLGIRGISREVYEYLGTFK